MPELSPAALIIAKAVLGPAYHPSKLAHPEPYTDAARALEAAGMLTRAASRQPVAEGEAGAAPAGPDEASGSQGSPLAR